MIVERLLKKGGRGLPGGQSLARLLLDHRGVRLKGCVPRLQVEQILAWADSHHAIHGAWPTYLSGQVGAAPDETWHNIDRALKLGLRGLSGGSTLSRCLAEHRGTPARFPAPKLTVEQVLAWADAHHEATGKWPNRNSGAIPGTQDETWKNVSHSLTLGLRGLPPSKSLADLLSRRRQVRNRLAPPELTIEQILAWADTHHAAHGRWPTHKSGRVFGAPDESWGGINWAVLEGHRGLPGGTTLSQLLAEHRPTKLPDLTLDTVRAWAAAHQKATGSLPGPDSGPVHGLPGESWNAINSSLQRGGRGLPPGLTLKKLLGTSRDRSPRRHTTPLTFEQIRAWAKRYHAVTGKWPNASSGPIAEAPGEVWSVIARALVHGRRGLIGGITLAEFIHRNLDPTVPFGKRILTLEEILSWADAHQERTGRWPTANSGPVPAEPGLTWSMLETALRRGGRGVGPGLSLFRLRCSRIGRPHQG
jgi:hypothetical protein